MLAEGKIDGRLEKAQKGTTMVFDPRHRAITARCHSRQGQGPAGRLSLAYWALDKDVDGRRQAMLSR